jgi:hypothetical protein
MLQRQVSQEVLHRITGGKTFIPFGEKAQTELDPKTTRIRLTESAVTAPHGAIRRGAEKSLAFPICSATKRIFLGWIKEVRTTKP